MSEPWEDFKTTEVSDGPWSDFQESGPWSDFQAAEPEPTPSLRTTAEPPSGILQPSPFSQLIGIQSPIEKPAPEQVPTEQENITRVYGSIQDNQLMEAKAAQPTKLSPEQEERTARVAILQQQLDQGLASTEDPQKRAELQASIHESMRQEGVLPVQPEATLTQAATTPITELPRLESETLMQLGIPEEAAKLTAGLQKGVISATEFMISPLGIATLGVGSLPVAQQRAISGAFAVDMARHTPELLGELGTALGDGDTEKATELVVSSAANIYFTGKSAKHALTPTSVLERAHRMDSATRVIEEQVGGTEFVSPDHLARQGMSPAPAPKSTPIGITPPSVAKLAEVQEAARLMDGKRIKNEISKQSVMPGRDWIASPEFEFRKDPVAKSIVVAANEAELNYRSQVSNDVSTFKTLQDSIVKTDQFLVTKALKDFESGKANAITSLAPELRSVAEQVRTYFDGIRNEVISGKVRNIESNLSPDELSVVRAMEGGLSQEAAFANTKFDELQRQTIIESVNDLKQARSWGIENYITHIERGSLRLVTADGHTIGRAETRVDAALKADRWLKDNPEHKSLTISDEFNPGVEFPTKLSKGQYFRFLNRASEELGRDVEVIQKILNEAGRVVSIKPASKFAGPMLERKGVFKGEENVFDILPAYSYAMRKKIALDPVMEEARQNMGKMDKTTQHQVEELLNDVRGRKSLADQIVDHLFTPQGRTGKAGEAYDRLLLLAGPKPFGFSRGVNVVRNIWTNLKLGWRPVAVAVNRVSGAMHTWVKTGTKDFLEGREFIKTPEGKEILERNKASIGMEANFALESTRPTTAEPAWAPLGLFQHVEKINRPEAFGAFYVHAKNRLGIEGVAAEQWAREAVRFAQFTYNTASLPRIMRNPAGRLVLQFKPYLVKELEFISTLRGQEIPRYMAASLLMGGPRAAIYTLMSLPLLGSLGLLDDLEDWLNQNAPRLSRGVPGLFGMDVSPAVAFQFPDKPEDWAGPALADFVRLWKDVLRPVVQGRNRDWSDVTDWASRLAPAMYWWSSAIESITSDTGWIRDQYGKMDYKPTNIDKVKMLMGAKPLEKSLMEVERKYLKETEDIQREDRQRTIEFFLKAIESDDGEAVEKFTERLAEMGVTPAQVRTAAKNRNIEPQIRLLRSISKQLRAKESKRFEEPESEEEEEAQ